jgi:Acetylornithine deacetylase/Succinyl-diaminopimelate desuccinylase and related deacylases
VAGTVRNSANPTMLAAGYKINVIPGEAVGFVDGRVLPGFSDEFRATLDELTGQDVTWEYAHEERSLEAPLEAPVMERMARALLAEDPGSVVVPYCMSGGTDAKQFSRLGMTCYGFTPLVLPRATTTTPCSTAPTSASRCPPRGERPHYGPVPHRSAGRSRNFLNFFPGTVFAGQKPLRRVWRAGGAGPAGIVWRVPGHGSCCLVTGRQEVVDDRS